MVISLYLGALDCSLLGGLVKQLNAVGFLSSFAFNCSTLYFIIIPATGLGWLWLLRTEVRPSFFSGAIVRYDEVFYF